MFIVTTTLDARPSSVGAARVGFWLPQPSGLGRAIAMKCRSYGTWDRVARVAFHKPACRQEGLW